MSIGLNIQWVAYKRRSFHIFDPPSAFFGILIAFIDSPQNTNHFTLVNPKQLPRAVQVKVSTGHVDNSGIIHEVKREQQLKLTGV
jgi:hypothetical protein